MLCLDPTPRGSLVVGRGILAWVLGFLTAPQRIPRSQSQTQSIKLFRRWHLEIGFSIVWAVLSSC